MSVVRGRRVLLIEDDIISGRTLQLIVDHLQQFEPQAVGLYLGHTKTIQHLQNVPAAIDCAFLAEELLGSDSRAALEHEFVDLFERLLTNKYQIAEQQHAADGATRRR